MRIIHLESAESTNSYLKSLAAKGCPSGTVVIADTQFKGRGSHERSFSSPKGGLYLSYLYTLDEIPADICVITQWTAVSVMKAIEKCCGIKCDIKYINDLLYSGKKVCGIMTELRLKSLIVGIGINVNSRTDDFPADLKDIITTIYEITGKKTDIKLLAKHIIEELDAQFSDFPDNDWRMKYYLENALYLPESIINGCSVN